ncbi:MAG: dephospho-CoA kinase [Anaerolineae bacterium]|nr:dephospho-CoA kinase [Anaerolineae bacterium]
MAEKIIIGLTGNIATGKSIVMRMLQELGATPIDADKLVHQLMQKGGPVYQAIVEEFGKYVLDEKGQISRPRLGKIVFSQPNALARLEALTHPSVIKEVKRLITKIESPVIVVEAIKLFESGLADECQSVWVVTAPPEMQLRRLVERRRMAPDQAKQRIRAQGSQREKAIKANVIIDNSGALVKTWQIVKKHYTDLVEANRPVQAAPEPKPAEPAPTLTPETATNLMIRRAKRDDLSGMSKLIAAATGGAIEPDISDMMESLFSRAYLVALTGGEMVGMVGWQTENLVAGLQDFYMINDSLWSSLAEKMLSKVEEEADSLSCEVALVFILNQAGQKPIEFLESQNYERAESSGLIPDWREAAVEWQPKDSILLYKKLREQRIMVPM